MTHQNHQTNGASLEDCHTNFFALTDLCGIKWRKFVNGERPNASSDPLEDPILRSYSRCMQADILCVWRRVQSTKQDTLDPNALSFEISSSKIHPPLSLAAAKELWIFWYGEEPDLNDLVDPELLRVAANQMLWNGTWEKGLTYECRSLLFKALHNLMERFVLTKDIVRFGKWFVQPCTSNDRIFGKSSQHLSFSFTFFVHGDTVCASIDLREHPAVRPLTKEHLAQAAAAFASSAQSGGEQHVNNGSNSGGCGVGVGGTLPPEDGLTLGNGVGAVNTENVPLKPRKVILAPFGMAATLTGNSYKATDPMAEKILDDWASFFPLCRRENSDVPPVVEVVSGGHKMYHPSMYVLVTDLDDMEDMEAAHSGGNPLDTACSSPEAAVLTAATACIGSSMAFDGANNKLNSAGKVTAAKTNDASASAAYLDKLDGSTKFQPYYETLANFTCNTTNTHAPPQAAIEMPERAWQDCIANSVLATSATTLSSSTPSNSTTTCITTTTNNIVNSGVSIKQEHIKMEVIEAEDGGNQQASATLVDGNVGAAASVGANNLNAVTTAELKHQTQQKLWNFVDPTQKAPCICTKSSVMPPASSQTPGGTPHGGASSYSRNSIGDSMAVPSVGSPSTPAPSPHPNSTLSQPTSVPPTDQLVSPRAPTSVSNLHQPPTPIDHMLLDKNTPAPTPTDQHDNKSITASPYVQPAPSVEPPPSAEGMMGTGSGSMDPSSVPPPPSVERCTPTIGHQQQQTQQQCGLITVKKFETQLSTITPLGAISGSGSKSVVCAGVDNASSNLVSASAAMADFLSLYKPPKLCTKDIENQANDDCLKLETLYDFTVQDAWVNHPVKRFRPNEVTKPCRPLRTKNLYDGHKHFKPLMPSPGSVYGTRLLMVDANCASSIGGAGRHNFSTGGLVGIASAHQSGGQSVSNNRNDLTSDLFTSHGIKLEGGSVSSPCKESKAAVGGNLFTAEGLNPSMNDLEQLFDTSSNEECGGVQIHTPPDSNNPSNGCAVTTTIDELKRSTAVVSAVLASTNNLSGNVGMVSLQNCVVSGGSAISTTTAMVGNNTNCVSLNNNLGASAIQPEDLTKMFPTPPSHEQHHPNSSPCQMDITMTDISVVTSTAALEVCGGAVGAGGMMKIKQHQQEYSVELGSPVEEPIEDWSYVYKPPQQSKFVGSSKYAPLTNLPSQTLPPLALPVNCVYKPSWTTQQKRAAVQQKQKQQQQQQQMQQHQQQQQHHHHHQQLQELLSAAPRTPLQQPRTPLGPMPSPSPVPQPLNSAGSNLLLNQLNCPQAALTSAPVGGPSMQQILQRAGMSPISPAAATVPFPSGSPMLHHQHPQQRRATPIHPPPPYEVAVASPATSTSSYLNKQFHSQEPQPRTPQSVGPPSANNCGHPVGLAGAANSMTTASAHAQRLPEVSSLIVNVLLYDTALNVFRDHNFDSSTVCVCNADSQKVGNIRGADSGVYVPLPGNSFNPGASAALVASGGSAGSASNMRLLSAFGGGGVGSALHSPASVPGAGSGHAGSNSSSSLTPTTGAGSSSNQHIHGYYDEDPVECTCGFSAVVNRRLAHRAGLFYEDELEITGIAEDPGRYKKRSLLSLISSLALALQPSPSNAIMSTTAVDSLLEKHSSSSSVSQQGDIHLANAIFDLLLEQCSIIQTSSSSIHRALQRYRRRLSKAGQTVKHTSNSTATVANVLEFVDANDLICLALEQARLVSVDSGDFPGYQQQQLAHLNLGLMHKHCSVTVGAGVFFNVHKWPYMAAGFTRSNKDIVRTMNAIQPMLQNAFHSKSRSAAGTKDATYTVSGPLTWRQFHRLAGRASGQCEPQPIPSVIVGHDKDWVSVAPLAIHYWDKFLLEPYSYARDVVYLIICPDNDYVIGRTRSYFKELSSTYEMCKLGRHTPMRGWDGLLSVGSKPTSNDKPLSTPLDDWLRTLADLNLAEKIRLFALAFQNMLVPYLNRIPNDKTLLNPPEVQNDGRCGSSSGRDRGTTSPLHGNNTINMSTMDAEKSNNSPPLIPKIEPHSGTAEQDQTVDIKPDIKPDVAKPTLIFGDPLGAADTMEDINPPAIVLYVVEPFTYGSDSPELERLACIALLRCYAEMLKVIPEAVRANINLQIISMESMLELGRARNRKRFSDEIKCLALNIFSQCRRHMVHGQTVKSLTGFGTAANMEVFLKSKDEKNRQPYKMYTPPFILAPIHEKNEKTDFSRATSGMRGFNEQQYSVMYCNYCMSEDQSWLLATATDNRGELLEKVCINIDVPNRARRRKAPARRVGLKKLMDFIMGIISQTAQPWRLVIGRIGRIGHSELKSWSYLLSKQSLQKATKQLKDMCKQCNLMYPPSILSACLVTLEPDAKLRVMPDQFTPDERFSQISMQNPLSTPQDVTCTHILVFPTSAVCLSFTRQFQNEPQVDIDNDFLNFDEFDEENDGCNNEDIMGAILGNWDTYARSSPQGSPGRIEDNRSWQSSGGNNFNSAQQQDIEEVGSINQQPLAVGYMVSTAPTGRMPAWFWAACPHLEDVCPVFLKTALHLHVPNIQTADDTITVAHSSATDHPLDSTLTADVLRYVLEGYNALSWLALDSNTHDRLSCLPINVQTLMDLYYLTAAIA